MQVPGAEYLMNMAPLELNIERGHLLGDIAVEDRMYDGLKQTYRIMTKPKKYGVQMPRDEHEFRNLFRFYIDEYGKLPPSASVVESNMLDVIGRRNVAQSRLDLVDDLLRGRRNVRQRLR